MGQHVIRAASEADWDRVADGFARHADRDPARTRATVAHAMRDNPHGASGIVALDARDRVVGHLGVTHLPMRIRGDDYVFGRFYACFIDPAYRTGGVHSLFIELDEMFREAFESRDRLAAVFGQWDELDWWFLRHTRGHKAIATSIDLCRAAAGALPTGEIRITGVDDGARSPAVLDVGACGVRRDGAFHAWRTAVPGANDRGWCAWREDALVGVAIARDRRDERLLVDWAVAPDDDAAGHALLAAVVGDGHVPVRARFWTSDAFTLALFQAAGFSVEAGTEAYLSTRTVVPGIDYLSLSQSWHVTMADAGVHPLPRLTIGEPIVYPPPPGTADGRGRYGH